MSEKVKFSHTGENHMEGSIVIGVLEVRPTRKGEEYWIDDVYLGSVLDKFDGKHVSVIIQEVVTAVTK